MAAALAIINGIFDALTSKVGAVVAWALVLCAAVMLAVSASSHATLSRQLKTVTGERDAANQALGQCRGNTASLTDALAKQNNAVAALNVQEAADTARAQKAVSDAQAATKAASGKVAKVLAAKPGPDACKSADSLILGSLP